MVSEVGVFFTSHYAAWRNIDRRNDVTLALHAGRSGQLPNKKLIYVYRSPHAVSTFTMPSKPKTNKGTKVDPTAQKRDTRFYIMVSFGFGLVALLASILVEAYAKPSKYAPKTFSRGELPEQVQIIDQKAFNVLSSVPPVTEANATTVCIYLCWLLPCHPCSKSEY